MHKYCIKCFNYYVYNRDTKFVDDSFNDITIEDKNIVRARKKAVDIVNNRFESYLAKKFGADYKNIPEIYNPIWWVKIPPNIYTFYNHRPKKVFWVEKIKEIK